MRLYKYFHPDRIDVLRGGKIRFSSPKVLNDPFELKPHVSALVPTDYLHSEFDRELPKMLAEEYKKLPLQVRRQLTFNQFQRLTQQHLPKAKEQVQSFSEMAVPMAQRIIAEKFEELIGILCLTETATNLLMWAHYADSHQGFVLEFDTTMPFFDQRRGADDELRHLRKVLYSDRRPSLVLTEIQDFSPFLTKGQDWSYEAEWRMMIQLSNASEVIGNGPAAIHLFEYPRNAIRSVILGCRMSETKEEEIRQVLRETDELSAVQCLKVQIDETHYRLCLTDARG